MLHPSNESGTAGRLDGFGLGAVACSMSGSSKIRIKGRRNILKHIFPFPLFASLFLLLNPYFLQCLIQRGEQLPQVSTGKDIITHSCVETDHTIPSIPPFSWFR